MKVQAIHRQTAVTAIAYGGGLLLGNLVSRFLFENVSPDTFLSGNPTGQLVLGVFLAFFIVGIGGAIGGAIGGYTLPLIGREKGRWGYTWRSSITFGLGYGLLVFPVVLVLSLFTFYAISDISPLVFSLIFAVIGIVFGFIMGLSLGLLCVGRRFPPITRISMIGFGSGGLVLGYAIHNFIFSVTTGNVDTGSGWWLSMGLLAFGVLGGGSLGFAFYRLANEIEATLSLIRETTQRIWQNRFAITGLVIFLVLLLIRPVISAVGDILTPIDATLSSVIDLPTVGTHWFTPTAVAPTTQPSQPTLASNSANQLGASWVQDGTLWLQTGEWLADQQETTWQPPTAVTTAPDITAPQIVIDDDGRSHLIWIAAGRLNYSQCVADTCGEPTLIMAGTACANLTANDNQNPTLTVNNDDLLLVWQNNDQLPYATWPIDETPPANAAGCVPTTNGGTTPRLAANAATLIFADSNSDIYIANYTNDNWVIDGERLGNGRYPAIFNNNGTIHAAWCGNRLITHWQGSSTTVATTSCLNRPELGLDNEGNTHIVWYADTVENGSGVTQPNSILYEVAQNGRSWTLPTIVGSAANSQPAMISSNDGSLHLLWDDGDQLTYTAQVQYHCQDGDDLGPISKAVYDTGRQGNYFPSDDPLPYCQNQYEGLFISPNPLPAFSDEPAPTNGVFDRMGDMIRVAQYEVLFSTMWYGSPENNDSPGSVIATAVADLYQQVQTNPENYPRGMTVRIMLGNPPELILGDDPTGQLWTLIDDLRQAGIDKMVDEEIGWRLEVADFEGNLPHSHVKTIIIDGKTAAANGFNMTYDHLPTDHPSGKGGGRLDLGLHITGPVVQATHSMFDDMWGGSDQRHCLDLDPPLNLPWQLTCYDKTAVTDHVPEVLKFYLPKGDSNAFSLYRSKVHDAADQQTISAINAAQETIDLIHVQFTLDTICNLNILFNICTVDIAPEYMPALVDAAQRGVHIRILVKPSPAEGIENNVALSALRKRITELGLDNVEIRFFEGPMHPKSIVVDNELLIIGSQNFHYSAYGNGGGLTEYSIATDDPQAVNDFNRLFAYYWETAQLPPE